MCFDSVQKFYAVVYGLGFLSPFGLYACWLFVKWMAVSVVRSIVNCIGSSISNRDRRPQHQPQHPRPQNPQHNNPNKLHNGQGQQNQGRPQQHFQQPLKLIHQTEEERPIESLWDVSTAATAYARTIKHTNDELHSNARRAQCSTWLRKG